MQRRLQDFIPVADEVWALQHNTDATSKLFQAVAEQGHYAGRTKPTNTRQGIYAFTPSGHFLASINTRHAAHMAEMLDRAKAAWDELDDAQRRAPADRLKALTRARGAEQRFPTDGLALTIYARDLPRTIATTDWRNDAWNIDYVWFQAREVASLIPEELAVGATATLEQRAADRLTRLHFVDNVRGQVANFEPKDVRGASIRSTVTAVDDETVTLELTGATESRANGRWPVADRRDASDPQHQTRGVRTTILGRATVDRATRRVTSFELLALGSRDGATQYNGRSDDLGPAPIGFLIRLESPPSRVPPSSFWAYRW